MDNHELSLSTSAPLLPGVPAAPGAPSAPEAYPGENPFGEPA